MKPTPAKPRIIMAQVEGSGTDDVTVGGSSEKPAGSEANSSRLAPWSPPDITLETIVQI
jgi:hypothetical protein